MTTKTLYDKIVDLHTIEKLSADGIERLVYIDRTVVNEYTSPQAFSLLRENGLKVWRPWATLGTVDHVNSSAPDRTEFPAEENACTQVKYLIKNGSDFGFEVLNNGNPKQGIEHVVMVERSKVLPGSSSAPGTATQPCTVHSGLWLMASERPICIITWQLRRFDTRSSRICAFG